MGTKFKLFITSVLLLVLVGVLLLYAYVNSNYKANHSQTADQHLMISTNDIEADINGLFFDDQHDFLIEDFRDEMIQPIKEKIDQLNESTIIKNNYLKQLEAIQQRFDAQKAVNDLFTGTQDAIRGNQVLTDLEVRQGLTKEKINGIKKKYYYEIATETKSSEKDDNKETEEAVELDNFQKAINQLIDLVEENISSGSQLVKLFEEVEKIEIEDGNIRKIAQAMNRFDQELEQAKTTSPDLYNRMNKKAEQYAKKVVEKILEIAQDIPQYYNLAHSALEPSERLTRALEEHRDEFDSLQTTTSVEVSRETTQATTNNDYYYEEPENSWTPPSTATPIPPVTSYEPIESIEPVEPTEDAEIYY